MMKERLPGTSFIPANSPEEGARWVKKNKNEALRRCAVVKKEIQQLTGQSSTTPSTSVPSAAYSQNWDQVFGKKKTK